MSPASTRRMAAVLAVWSLLLAPLGASAQPEHDVAADSSANSNSDGALAHAKKAFEKGQKLFALARFEEALAAYEEAYQAKSLPEFLFNIGQCHRNMGNYRQAIHSFRTYLSKKPGAPNRVAVDQLIRELEGKLADEKERERSAAEMRRQEELTRDLQGPREPPPRAAARPIYKKWWFWAGAVGVAAVGGTGAVLLLGGGDSIPSSDLGNVDFGR